MNKRKEIQFLEHRIKMLGKKIAYFEKNNISEEKQNDLKLEKIKYETQLEDIEYE